MSLAAKAERTRCQLSCITAGCESRLVSRSSWQDLHLRRHHGRRIPETQGFASKNLARAGFALASTSASGYRGPSQVCRQNLPVHPTLQVRPAQPSALVIIDATKGAQAFEVLFHDRLALGVMIERERSTFGRCRFGDDLPSSRPAECRHLCFGLDDDTLLLSDKAAMAKEGIWEFSAETAETGDRDHDSTVVAACSPRAWPAPVPENFNRSGPAELEPATRIAAAGSWEALARDDTSLHFTRSRHTKFKAVTEHFPGTGTAEPVSEGRFRFVRRPYSAANPQAYHRRDFRPPSRLISANAEIRLIPAQLLAQWPGFVPVPGGAAGMPKVRGSWPNAIDVVHQCLTRLRPSETTSDLRSIVLLETKSKGLTQIRRGVDERGKRAVSSDQALSLLPYRFRLTPTADTPVENSALHGIASKRSDARG
nr:hypothetical protein CFP56_00785 [Quercus suber]